MNWHYTPYTLLLLAVAAMALLLALYMWRRRDATGAKAVAALMLAVFAWSLGYAFELGESGLGVKVLWAKFEYLGIATIPAAWLVFALQYAGREKWVTRRNLMLLAVLPLVTLVLVFTNEAHGLIWSRTAVDGSGVFLILDHGPFFWVYWIYSYVLLVLGTYFLISFLLRAPGLYRRQTWALLLGACAPWVGNGMYVMGINPLPGVDLTPFAFLFTGAALSLGLFRLKLLDIIPVARDAVIEGMNDGVIVVDSRGRIVDLNPAARRVPRLSAAEAVGKPLSEVEPGIGALLEGLDAEETQKEITLAVEQQRRDYEVAISTLRNRRGDLTGRLMVLRDVTERKKTERALIHQQAELERANAEVEHFAYLIAHDLRAPLRGINGFSHILLEDYADAFDEEGKDYLDRIGTAARHMGRMIDELLDFSRITRMELRREPVDLSALADNVVSELKQSQPGRQVEFIISGDLEAEGDRRLLKVALANLLENAWKFTSKNPESKIEFGVDATGAEPVYFVRDNGAGFDMAYADKLFVAFQRLHSNDEFEGVGIGLAAVSRIIERHGGRVWAESEMGKGATFYFTL